MVSFSTNYSSLSSNSSSSFSGFSIPQEIRKSVLQSFHDDVARTIFSKSFKVTQYVKSLRPTIQRLSFDNKALIFCLKRWDELVQQNRLLRELKTGGWLNRLFSFEDRVRYIKSDDDLTRYETLILDNIIREFPELKGELLMKLEEAGIKLQFNSDKSISIFDQSNQAIVSSSVVRLFKSPEYEETLRPILQSLQKDSERAITSSTVSSPFKNIESQDILRPALRSLQDDKIKLGFCLMNWDRLVEEGQLVTKLTEGDRLIDRDLTRFFHFEGRIRHIQTETDLTKHEILILNRAIKGLPGLVNEFLEKLKEEIEFQFELNLRIPSHELIGTECPQVYNHWQLAEVGLQPEIEGDLPSIKNNEPIHVTKARMLKRNDWMLQLLEQCYSTNGILNSNFANASFKEREFRKEDAQYNEGEIAKFFRPNRHDVVELAQLMDTWLISFRTRVLKQRKTEEIRKAAELENQEMFAESEVISSVAYKKLSLKIHCREERTFQIENGISSKAIMVFENVSMNEEVRRTKLKEECKDEAEQFPIAKLEERPKVETSLILTQQIKELDLQINLFRNQLNSLSPKKSSVANFDNFIQIFTEDFITKVRVVEEAFKKLDWEARIQHQKQMSSFNRNYKNLFEDYQAFFDRRLTYIGKLIEDQTSLFCIKSLYLFVEQVYFRMKAMPADLRSKLTQKEIDLYHGISRCFEAFKNTHKAIITSWASDASVL